MVPGLQKRSSGSCGQFRFKISAENIDEFQQMGGGTDLPKLAITCQFKTSRIDPIFAGMF